MRTPTERQIQIMRLALGLSGMVVNDAGAEIVLRVVSGIEERGDKFDLRDAARIESIVSDKYRRRIEVKAVNVKKKSRLK